jgi:hypothetical protein
MSQRKITTFALALVAISASGLTTNAAVLLGNGQPNPADAGLVLWLDSSDASTLWQDPAGTVAAAAGQPIARWDDKSQSGIIVNQGNPANTPSYATGTGALGGVNTVSFTGGAGGDALTSTTGNSTGVGNILTLVTVWQTTGFTGQNYQHSFHMGNTVVSQAYGHSVSRGGNIGELSNHYWGSGFDSTGIDGGAPGAGHLGLSTYDGVTDSFYYDGAGAGTNAVSVNIGLDQLQIGSRLNPFTEGFTGEIAEVIMFNSVLSDNDRNLLGGYIQNKYGLTIAGAIPEPSAAMLSLLGLLGLLTVRRRK